MCALQIQLVLSDTVATTVNSWEQQEQNIQKVGVCNSRRCVSVTVGHSGRLDVWRNTNNSQIIIIILKTAPIAVSVVSVR